MFIGIAIILLECRLPWFGGFFVLLLALVLLLFDIWVLFLLILLLFGGLAVEVSLSFSFLLLLLSLLLSFLLLSLRLNLVNYLLFLLITVLLLEEFTLMLLLLLLLLAFVFVLVFEIQHGCQFLLDLIFVAGLTLRIRQLIPLDGLLLFWFLFLCCCCWFVLLFVLLLFFLVRLLLFVRVFLFLLIELVLYLLLHFLLGLLWHSSRSHSILFEQFGLLLLVIRNGLNQLFHVGLVHLRVVVVEELHFGLEFLVAHITVEAVLVFGFGGLVHLHAMILLFEVLFVLLESFLLRNTTQSQLLLTEFLVQLQLTFLGMRCRLILLPLLFEVQLPAGVLALHHVDQLLDGGDILPLLHQPVLLVVLLDESLDVPIGSLSELSSQIKTHLRWIVLISPRERLVGRIVVPLAVEGEHHLNVGLGGAKTWQLLVRIGNLLLLVRLLHLAVEGLLFCHLDQLERLPEVTIKS